MKSPKSLQNKQIIGNPLKLVLVLFLSQATCSNSRLNQKDFNLIRAENQVPNLSFFQLDKKNHENKDSDLMLAQIQSSQNLNELSSRQQLINQSDLEDLMKETFSKKQSNSDSDQKEENNLKQAEPIETEELTLTEQMALAKKQASELEKQSIKEEQERQKREQEEAQKKKMELEKQKAEKEKNKDKDAKEKEQKEMDDFIEKQLEAQRKHREEYDKELMELSGETENKKTAGLTHEQQVQLEIEKAKKEAQEGETQYKKNLQNTDDILNNVGMKLAERTFEQKLQQNGGNLQIEQLNKDKQDQNKKQEEEKNKKEQIEKEKKLAQEQKENERKQRLQSKLESFEQSDSEKPLGIIERASMNLELDKDIEEKVDPQQEKKANPPQEEQIQSIQDLNTNNNVLNKQSKIIDLQNQEQELPIYKPKEIKQLQKDSKTQKSSPPAAFDINSLIKNAVNHQKLQQKSEPSQPKQAPIISKIEIKKQPKQIDLQKNKKQEQKAIKKQNNIIDKKTQEKVNAQLQQDLQEKGERQPSDITKALIDSSDSSQPIGKGFFGKYLKKHIELKKQAENKVLEEQKQQKERIEKMKKQLSMKISEDPPAIVSSDPNQPVVILKKKKKTLSERAQQKLLEDESKKSMVAQAKQNIAQETMKIR